MIVIIFQVSGQKNIHGKVCDENGNPISAARIYIPELRKAYRTDSLGLYSISIDNSNSSYTFRFSYKDLFPSEYRFNYQILQGKNTLDVTLKSSILSLSLQELMNMNITSAAKTPQKATEAPNIVNLLFDKQIHSMGWNSINEILGYQTAFSLSQDYERSTIGYRGISESWNNNHILLLIDGVPFNDNLYGTAYTWDVTPLIFSKSIEIMKGPNSSLYGNNALNGVISLNTLKAESHQKFGEVRLSTGNQGTQCYDVILGKESKRFGFISSISVNKTLGNEYESYDNHEEFDNQGQRVKHLVNDSRRNLYFFNKIYGKDQFEGLNLQYHEQHWDYETGHGWLFTIPQTPESMKEFRRILSVKYAPTKIRSINYELVSRYQKHGLDWNMNFFPAGVVNYPNGVNEYIKTDAEDIFIRAQMNYAFNNRQIIFFGMEYDHFWYNGDQHHSSNIDMNMTYNYFPENSFNNLSPWLEYIDQKPIHNYAAYIQYISPKISDHIQFTLDGRFDGQQFKYSDIKSQDFTVHSKSFNLLTYRASLVFAPSQKLSLKFISGRAFRTPSPTEMFGSNTYTLASNLEELKPEIVNSYDLAMNWVLNSYLHYKLNVFYLDFINQIAYSTSNENLSTNVYSLKTTGLECEINYSRNKIQGFINYSFTHRLDEEIYDSTIAVSSNKLTWMPSHQLNMGLVFKTKKICTSLLAHYQGKVFRRESDYHNETQLYRPNHINPWLNIDSKITYNFSQKLYSSFAIKNILNNDQYLIKNHSYPFDYRRDKIRILLELGFRF